MNKKRQRTVKSPAKKSKSLSPKQAKESVRKVLASRIKGAEISTDKNSKTLLKLLLGADNTSGHMGCEGYEVNKKNALKDGTIVIMFKERSCGSHSISPVFIKGKNIYAHQILDVVMNILQSNEISFFFKANAILPQPINSYLNKKRK